MSKIHSRGGYHTQYLQIIWYRALYRSATSTTALESGNINTSVSRVINVFIDFPWLFQAAQGTGLAFQVMADVFTMLPGSPFW